MTEASATGSRTSPISLFKLTGLFGYKTVELRFASPVKIVSAENGTGKTTLLNALYWTLTGQFFRLNSINFAELHLNFSNGKVVQLAKPELSDLNFKEVDASSLTFFRRFGLTRADLTTMAQLFLSEGDSPQLRDFPPYKKMYEDSPYDHDDIQERLQSLIERHVNQEKFSELKRAIDDGLDGTKVLYLPTYRRIEANLLMQNQVKEGATDQLIYFGLSDVERTLKTLTESIRKTTLESYLRISGRFLDNLVENSTGQTRIDQGPSELDQEAMKTVLARIGKNSEDLTVKRIDELIESGEIGRSNHYHLHYFLAQLTNISRLQASEEGDIESFIRVVNQYWKAAQSDKKFVYDKYTVDVYVNNTITETKIPLHVLSSGEKQIISVFARLYFSKATEYFVIIDEPELSLSIEWQRLFLPDIVATPKCRGLLAITHSPFVFENNLDRCAASLVTSTWRG
nr:AAA family ATPase [Aquabacterium terrae]